MPEAEGNGLAERLWRLPGQLLLALVNATAVLVIAAAILTLVAVSRIDGIAHRLTATITDAAFSRLDVDPSEALTNLEGLREEIRDLTDALSNAKGDGSLLLAPRIERLDQRLNALQSGLDAISQGRSALINEALAEIGRSFADAIGKLRGCGPAR